MKRSELESSQLPRRHKVSKKFSLYFIDIPHNPGTVRLSNIFDQPKENIMKLRVFVEFTVSEPLGALAPETPFKTIEELQDYIAQQKETLPYFLEVNRSCYVADQDLPGKKPEKHHSGTFKFIVSDKLMYPQDAQNYLKLDEKPISLQINNANEIQQNTPVLFRELAHYPMDNYTKKPQKKRDNHFEIRPLTAQDIVVDKNLHQIWPEQTGKAPLGLVKMLQQTTEKVYE